jgi:hypothetical protein
MSPRRHGVGFGGPTSRFKTPNIGGGMGLARQSVQLGGERVRRGAGLRFTGNVFAAPCFSGCREGHGGRRSWVLEEHFLTDRDHIARISVLTRSENRNTPKPSAQLSLPCQRLDRQ